MGYAKSKLRLVKKASRFNIWVVALIFVAISIMAFCLLWDRLSDLKTRSTSVDDDYNDVNEDRSTSQKIYQDSSHVMLNLGDYCDFQDEDFCRQHGVDVEKVSKGHDPYRHADVYTYTFNGQQQHIPDVWIKTLVKCDECSNRIVERSVVSVMTAEGDKGTERFNRGCLAVAAAVVKELSAISAFSCEGNEIVASSPNITYRGHDKAVTEKILSSAVLDISRPGGVVAIQWQTPRFFVAWHLLVHKGVYTMLFSQSDRLIRTDVFGNE